MADLTSLYDEHKDLSDADAMKAGKAIQGTMGDAHTDFVKLISKMLQAGEINPFEPETFLKNENYDKLSEEQKSQVNLSMVNVADLLRHVADFYLSKETPDASPQLQTMIEQLWEMKERVEKTYGDVFKF
jgi:hypothetical protein